MPDALSLDNDVLSFTPGNPMLAPPPPPPVGVVHFPPDSPAAPPAPTARDYGPEITQNRAAADAEIAKVKEAQAAQVAAMQGQATAQQPFIDKALAQTQQPLPARPKQEKPPAVPQRQSQHEDEQWLFASALLGSLAGALTRRHQTNALAAFSGAMEGYNEGSKQKFDQNMRTWEAENKRALETNKQAMDEYRDILEDRKLTTEQMFTAIKLAGLKNQDQAAIEVVKLNNADTLAKYYDKRAEAAQNAQESSDRLLIQERKADERNKANQIAQWEEGAARYVASDEGQKRIAETMAFRRPPPSQGVPRNNALGYIERAVSDELSARGFDWNKAYGKAAGARVEGATEARKEQRTEIAFAVGPEARSVRSLNVAIAHLDTLDTLAKALGASDFPVLNRISNRVETALGYAMPKSFDAAKQIVSAEIIKAVVANGGGVNERRDAAETIDKAGSYEQLSQVIATYKSLLGGQMKGLKKQYEDGTGKTDFLNKLEPETIKALEEAGIAPTPTTTPPGYRKTGDPTTTFEQLGGALTTPWWNSPLPQSVEDKLPQFMHPRKADPPFELPAGWSFKEVP